MPRFEGIPVEPRFKGEPVEEREYSGLTAAVMYDMPMGERFKEAGRGLARGAGVTARNVLTGVEGLVDFLGMPIRASAQMMGFNDPAGGSGDLADVLNLPHPQGKTENVISQAEQFIASGAPVIKGAQMVAKGGSKLAEAFAARPDMQLASLGGAGLASGYAKESGASPWVQLVSGLGGGLAAPASMSAGQKIAGTLHNMARPQAINIKVDTVINNALKDKGVTLQDVSLATRNALRKDIAQAFKVGDPDPDVVRRLVDYRLTGATPTAGPITQDPGIITRQKNLASMGAASNDPKLQQLSQVQNNNVRVLIENMNKLGAGTADDQLAASQKIMNVLDDIAVTEKGKIDPLYTAARNMVGRSAQMDHVAFTNRAADLIDEAMLNYKLPQDVKNTLNSISQGKTPLTVEIAEQIKTSIGRLQRSSKDPAERLALGMVRQALEETPLMQGQGKAAIEAFNAARSANREWMKVVERTPALKAAIDNIEPDKFMDKFIIGSSKDAAYRNVAQLKSVIKSDPGAQSIIKNYIARYLKKQATSGSEDEFVKWSSSAYNKALDRIGDQKLKLFFDKEEYAMLKAVGRVGSYEQSQPVGSAVNNSKSATTWAANALDWIGNIKLLRRIPLGAEIVGDPAKSVSQSIQASKIIQLPAPVTPKQRTMSPAPLLGLGAVNEVQNNRQGN